MEIKKVGEIEIAVIPKRLDAYAAEDVGASLKNSVQKGVRTIICDFSDTEYVASAGLRVLLLTAKILQKAEGLLLVCSLKPYVQEIFETAGFTQIFRIHNSADEAVASLQEK